MNQPKRLQSYKCRSTARNQPRFTMIAHDQQNKFTEIRSTKPNKKTKKIHQRQVTTVVTILTKLMPTQRLGIQGIPRVAPTGPAAPVSWRPPAAWPAAARPPAAERRRAAPGDRSAPAEAPAHMVGNQLISS